MAKTTTTKKDETTDLAEVKANELAASSFDYGDDSGVGFEDVKGSDLSIPFINLLQSNSPEVQKCEDGTIIMGMMKNSVTGEYYKRTGFTFLPVHKEEAFVEWVPRIKGGGFVKLHSPTSDEVSRVIERNGGRMPKKGADGKKIPIMIGENELVETYYVYGLLLDDDCKQSSGFAVIAFTSTKIRVYRDWLTAMFMIRGRPPMYAIPARISVDIQKNESGTFGNYVISPAVEGNWVKGLLPLGSDLYVAGKEFQKMVIGGLARADFDSQGTDTTSGAGDYEDSPSAGDSGNKEEIPF